VFYAVNGVGATQTLIDVNNLTLQNSCNGSDQTPEFRNTIDNSQLDYQGTTTFIQNDDFDIGDTFGEGGGLADDEEAWTAFYSNPVGQEVVAHLDAEDGANEVFVSVDCALTGYYVAL